MPAKGHKEGCQCAICKQKEIGVKPKGATIKEEPPGVPLASLSCGQYFNLGGDIYKLQSIGIDMARVIFTECSPLGAQRIDRHTTSLPLEVRVKPL